ncbi:glycosyltransferase 87 family protein [Marixanthomonas spongiae]|uniref:glycosyltransferase 87 family protein n=1 Tax=Marixanthomonas spongiae TaxID=2174845 RepID=UPI001F0C2887|nr:glycosyltransferase 87 family protein [Marixanthomonas spongiae]
MLFAVISVALYASFGYDLHRSNFAKLLPLYGALFLLAYKLIQITRGNFWVLFGFGIAFRLVFLIAIPNLSQDFYRFIWDGRLLLQGINPYLFTPEMYTEGISGLLSLPRWLNGVEASELIAGMGALNASHFSNYPPVNQLFFAIAALFGKNSILGSVVVLRIIMILADVGVFYFGRKLLKNLNLNPHTIFWYFLNPFIIIELTGNLHFEGVMLFFLVWALYLLFKGKWFWAAVLLGVSVSVKLLPLLFLPLFFNYFLKNKKDFSLRFIPFGMTNLILFYAVCLLTVLVTFLPFLSSEFLQNFSATIALWFQNFEFNASVYYIIRWVGFQTVGWNIIGTVGKIMPLIVMAFLLVLAFFRRNETLPKLMTTMLFGVSFYFLLSTTVHPWYVATPLILCLFTKYRFPVVWSAAVILSYSAYGPDGFKENLWLVATEYIVVIGYAVWEILFFKVEENKFNANKLKL